MSGKVRAHIRSNIIGYIALFFALSTGSAVALNGSNTVFTDDIVNDQVYSADVRNDTLSGGGLTAADLRAGSVGASEVAADSLGAGDLALSSVGTSEVADNSLTGADVNESTLGTVPAAADLICPTNCASDSEVSDTLTVGASGTVNDAALSSTVANTNVAETFSTGQTFNGGITVNDSSTLGNGGDRATVNDALRLVPLSGSAPPCLSVADVGTMYFDADSDQPAVCIFNGGFLTYFGLVTGTAP